MPLEFDNSLKPHLSSKERITGANVGRILLEDLIQHYAKEPRKYSKEYLTQLRNALYLPKDKETYAYYSLLYDKLQDWRQDQGFYLASIKEYLWQSLYYLLKARGSNDFSKQVPITHIKVIEQALMQHKNIIILIKRLLSYQALITLYADFIKMPRLKKAYVSTAYLEKILEEYHRFLEATPLYENMFNKETGETYKDPKQLTINLEQLKPLEMNIEKARPLITWDAITSTPSIVKVLSLLEGESHE